MRRNLFILLLTIVFFCGTSVLTAEAVPTHTATFVVGQESYSMDGQVKQMDAATFIKEPDGRAFVPIRYLGLALGLDDQSIIWDNASHMVILKNDTVTVVLRPDQKNYYVNGQLKAMDTAPLLQNGRNYLPARYIAEAFGYSVQWDASSKSVIIAPDNSNSSGATVMPNQTTTQNLYNLQVLPAASSAQPGQPVGLIMNVTGSGNTPAAGVTVNLTSTSSGVQLSSTSVTTNSQGQALVTATDQNSENVTFTATIPSSANTAAATASVQWAAGQSQVTQAGTSYYLQISASSSSAVVGQPVVFTVTASNNTGNPISGINISVASSSAGSSLNATSLLTNAQGQAFFTAVDNNQESVTFTVNTAGGTGKTTSVLWSSVSMATSTSYQTAPSLQITSNANTAVVGQPVVFTVTATGNNGLAVGKALMVTSSSSSAQPGSNIVTTNGQGQAFFTAMDNNIENVFFTIKMVDNQAVMATSTIQWAAAYAQQTTTNQNTPIYSLQITPSPSMATNGQPVILTLTVADSNGQLAGGIGVSVISSSLGAQMSSTFVTTDSSGHAYITVTDNNIESVTFTANLANVTSRNPYVTTSVQWQAQGTGSNVYNTGKVYVSGYYVGLSQSTTAVPAGQPVVLTVTVTNSSNQPVSGIGVTVTSSSSHSQMTQSSSVTNSQGQVYVTVSDSVAENVTFYVGLTGNSLNSSALTCSMRWY